MVGLQSSIEWWLTSSLFILHLRFTNFHQPQPSVEYDWLWVGDDFVKVGEPKVKERERDSASQRSTFLWIRDSWAGLVMSSPEHQPKVGTKVTRSYTQSKIGPLSMFRRGLTSDYKRFPLPSSSHRILSSTFNLWLMILCATFGRRRWKRLIVCLLFLFVCFFFSFSFILHIFSHLRWPVQNYDHRVVWTGEKMCKDEEETTSRR